MMLLRALHAEMLKMKRTIALKMVVFSPAVVALLIFFVVSQAPYSTVHRNNLHGEWIELTRLNLRVWTSLMLPLYITLQAALISGLDHSENQWKSLLARPVPRWTFYVAKLIVLAGMTAGATLLLLCCILIDGAILPRIQSELVFGAPIPLISMFRDCLRIAGLMFLALTIQHWISLRWRSFSIAVGSGIVATVVGFFCVAVARHVGDWPQYFPWALPMMALAKEPQNITVALTMSCALGLMVAAAGCLDFCTREVS